MDKRLLVLTALLVLPDVAAAQMARPAPGNERPDRPGRPGPGHSGGPQGQPGRPDRPGPGRPGGPQTQPGRPGAGHPGGPQIQPPRPGRPGAGRPGGPQIQPPRPGRPGQPGRPGRPNQPGRPPVGARPPYRPGMGRPPQFRPIRGPAFRYPRGYGYRRWSTGLILPRLFLSSSYYYDGYDGYDGLGLGAPPPGCRWVRYGPDLLLVQTRSGRIVDVIYGAFL